MVRSISAVFDNVKLGRRTAVLVGGVCGFALASALAAQVRLYVPFSPVPVTLQTFAVLLSGATLGAWAGLASQMVYLGLCAVGAPVFAGGAAALPGATLGYLAAFPIAAWVVGLMRDKWGRLGLPAGLVVGNLVIYAFGAAWLGQYVQIGFGAAVMMGVIPFLAGDALKVVGAWACTGGARFAYERALGRNSRDGELEDA